MIQLDTVKLQGNLLPSVSKFNVNSFRLSKHTVENQKDVSVSYIIKTDDILGLSTIQINPITEVFKVEFSAKILGKDYPKLISENTILQALESINQQDCLTIRPSQFLENAIVHKVDCTQDIDLDGYKVDEVLNVLSAVYSRGYTLEPYPTQGIVITRVAKSNNCREKFYNKQEEILNDKQLVKVVDLSYFDNRLRCEGNFRKYHYIRKYFGIKEKGTIPLKKVLQSKEKPNYKFFSEWENPIPSLFDEIEDYDNFRDYLKFKGWKAIIQDCHYREDLILLMLKKFYPESKSSQYRILDDEAKKYIYLMTKKINPKSREIIEYIRKKLKQG